MPKPGRTQKQIAERYKGNLGYYNKLHPWRRARHLVSLIAVIGGVLAVWWFSRYGRESFLNAGPISSNHSSIANDCAKCHAQTLVTGSGVAPHRLVPELVRRLRTGVQFDEIDLKCQSCHKQHAFHEANVVQDRSCSTCHQEHEGPGPLRQVASSQCLSCHANERTMEASAQKGLQIPPGAFHRHPHPPQQVVFELPRPPRGYTETFNSFAQGHPDFQLSSTKLPDPDILRFNHQRHLAADIPPVNGQKLDCAFCHKPEPQGRYYERISFKNNCQPCHTLQFDVRNPDLKIPHGDVGLVRAFLHSLPQQYGEYARTKRGLSENQVPAFVAQQIRQLRDQFHTGEQLEQAVFFTTNPYQPAQKMEAASRASFAGCALCHEVKSGRNAEPSITQPSPTDRWMPQAEFNHTKHLSVNCEVCHRAAQSRDTADILMPVKADCVKCHSPAGKVSSECITCHRYHAPAAAQPLEAMK